MIKVTLEQRERYSAPLCEAMEMVENGTLCVSGQGGIDDGSLDEWGDF